MESSSTGLWLKFMNNGEPQDLNVPFGIEDVNALPKLDVELEKNPAYELQADAFTGTATLMAEFFEGHNMHFRQLSGYSKLVSFIIVLFMGAWSQSSLATWTGAYGYQYYSKTVCATSRDENISSKIDYGWTAAPICSFDIGEGNAVPESGQYSLVGFFPLQLAMALEQDG